MARPTTWQDIPTHERRGDQIANWSSYNVMAHPFVAEHLVAAAKAASKLGLIVTNDGIFEPLSAEKLEANLLKAQERWDALKNKYDIATDFPTERENGDLWEINNWARENGYPTLAKPAEVSF